MSTPRALTPELAAGLLYLYYVKGLTQIALSMRFGIAQATVSKYLRDG
jgi:DNA-binding transcriptional regulator LsrR (DeoR family)